eukprot:superscaffoldBa00000952_g8178
MGIQPALQVASFHSETCLVTQRSSKVCLLSAGFNCFLVACVILVVLLLTLELLVDTKLLQFNNAFQFASIIHWISLAILSVFFTEVFDGAVIVLSLAPMVASTVANGPSSPWDAIGLIITLRIWRVKRIIDAYVLQVKVEMELEIQQYEKAKAVREEQLDRLTQICQEQAFEIRQLRAHLAQQDLDLVAEREAAMQIHHMWGKQSSSFHEVDGLAPGASEHHGPAKAREPGGPADHHGQDDMNNYISQYYSEPSSGEHQQDPTSLCSHSISSTALFQGHILYIIYGFLVDMGIPDPAARVITTAAIDVHLPNNPSQLPSSLVSADAVSSSRLQRTGSSVSEASTTTVSRTSFSARQHSISSHTLGSTTDCSSTVREASTSTDYSDQRCYPPPYSSPLALGTQPRGSPSTVVQELLSSLTEDSCLTQKGLDPVNLKPPSPTGSTKTSPELEHRLNIYNKRNQESRVGLHAKPLIHLHGNEPLLEEKYRMMEPVDAPVNRLSET